MNSPACTTKECKSCGSVFGRHPKDSATQWAKRAFCSIKCANKSKNKPADIVDRLMRHVSPVPIAGCWLWTSATDSRGYGQISMGANMSPRKAHRVSYEAFVGEIPAGMVVRHRCDTPLCINPNHLEIGTQKDNANDMMVRGRWNRSVMENLRHDRSFDKETALSIMARVRDGETMTSIAKEYGVDRSTVSLYINGKR